MTAPPGGAHDGPRAPDPFTDLLLGALGEGVYGVDLEGRATFLNPAACRMLGYRADELLGHRQHDLIHHCRPDGRPYPADECPIYAVLRDGRTRRIKDDRFCARDGRCFPVEYTATAVRDGGRVVGAVVVFRDATERKRREEADRFLAEAGQVIVATLAWAETLHGLTALVVPRMGDWCVASVFDPEGGPDQVEVGAAERGLEERLRERVRRSPRAYGRENDLVGRALLAGRGECLTALTAADRESLAGGPGDPALAAALESGSALVVPLVAEARAIGALILGRRPGRPALGTRELLLVEEVARRAALSIEHARQHRRSAEAIRGRDEVLRVVAHDLRGLVSAISLSAARLDGTGQAAGREGAVQVVAQAAARMDRLIQDLLDVSRVEGGHLPLEPVPVDPAVLLREAAEAAEPLARDRQIAIVRGPDRSLPPVRADASRVLQVLANLLGNAIHFTPEGGRIRIKAERLGDEVVFCVQDNGPGIDPADLSHVFDRFWRGRPSVGGAGLGLAIARGIVEAHSGRIWVASEQGEGSRFCFTLPRSGASRDAHPTRGLVL